MNSTTIERLNQINREFYRITAEHFDESRGEPWPGWNNMLPYLRTPLSVLDVGCGNGRFGVFLTQQLGTSLTYYGLDNNPVLLERARESLFGIETRLEIRDVVEQPPVDGEFDLVVLFGMLHHIPGCAQRRAFMRALAQCVAPGGLFVFSAWRFYDYERFRERIIPWPADIQVESHDYLIDWRRGTHAVRYCHYVDETEHTDLITATELTEVITYRADGRTNDMNRYSLLRRDYDEH